VFSRLNYRPRWPTICRAPWAIALVLPERVERSLDGLSTCCVYLISPQEQGHPSWSRTRRLRDISSTLSPHELTDDGRAPSGSGAHPADPGNKPLVADRERASPARGWIGNPQTRGSFPAVDQHGGWPGNRTQQGLAPRASLAARLLTTRVPSLVRVEGFEPPVFRPPA
jgi:hypothetical protein